MSAHLTPCAECKRPTRRSLCGECRKVRKAVQERAALSGAKARRADRQDKAR